MGHGDSAEDFRRTLDWLDDETSADIADGRLSAIMPRKLFQDDAAVKSGLLQVFVRMKPLPAATAACMLLDNSNLLRATWRNTEAVYKFSRVFQQDADQGTVYAGTTSALVDDFLSFRQPSAVIMAYGVTSAGKTFTMQGTPEKPGLVPLALKDIFQSLNKQSSACGRVSLSVCEIYNENIYDLLAPVQQRAKPAALRLKEDKSGMITVVGAADVEVRSIKEALELLRKAAKARQSAGTGVNEHSSRSHAVITVKLQTAVSDHCPSKEAPQQSFLHFVDLAGCERVKRTGNSGARLRESVAINSSLMTLARCLEVLRYNQQHPADQKVIPYRESKITHLFKGVLHGNGRFAMVVNVSPASEAFNETKRVLQYAALASKVTMTSEVEHDIAGGAWPSTSNAPAELAAQAAASAGGAAAAAAASAALSAAQARIEELLDDKADLEYEIDVVERKVELLREELIKSEVEKEQLEADIRAEIQEEMQQLMEEAAAKAKTRAAQAEEEAAALKQQVSELLQQLEVQAAELQQHKAQRIEVQVLQDALDEAKHTMIPPAQHKQLLEQAREQATAAAQQQQAAHKAKAAVVLQDHQQQVNSLQEQLSAAKAESEALQQRLSATTAEAQQQVHAARAEAMQQVADLKTLVAGALRILEEAVAYQQKSTADAQELASTAQEIQAALAMQQQQRQQQQQGKKADSVRKAVSSATPACAIATQHTNAEQAMTCDVEAAKQQPQGQLEQQLSQPSDALEPDQQTSELHNLQHTSHYAQREQEQHNCSNRQAEVEIGAAAAAQQQQPELSGQVHQPEVRRRTRRATMAAAVPLASNGGPLGTTPTAATAPQLHQQEGSAGKQIAADSANDAAVTAATDCKQREQTTIAGSAAAAAAVVAADATQQADPAADGVTADQQTLLKRRRSSRRSMCKSRTAIEEASDVKQQAHGVAGICHSSRLPLGSIAEAEEGEEEELPQQGQVQCMNRAAEAAAEGATAVAVDAEHDERPPATRKRRRMCEHNADMSCKEPEAATAAIERPHKQQQQQRQQPEDMPGTQGVTTIEESSAAAQQCAEDPVMIDIQDIIQEQPAAEPAAAVQEAQQSVTGTDLEELPGRVRNAGSRNSRKAGKSRALCGTKKGQKSVWSQNCAADQRKPPGPLQKPQSSVQYDHPRPSQQQRPQRKEQKDNVEAAAVEEQALEDPVAVEATKSNKARPADDKLDSIVEHKAAKGVRFVPSSTAAAAADEGWQPAEQVLKDVTQQQLGIAVGRRATFAAGGSAAATAVGRKGTASSKQQQLPHIAGGITPVAFRTRHRGAR